MSEFIVEVYHQANEDSWCEAAYRGADPRKAIQTWAKLEIKHPTCVSISVRRREEACELIDYAYENMEWIKELCEKRGFPYKSEYIMDGIGTGHQTGCESFGELCYGGEYYPDQVYPFCLG